MRLEVDIGNTRIKWRLRNGESVTETFAAATAISCENDFNEVFNLPDLSSVKSIYVSNVVPRYHQLFFAWCGTRGYCQPIFAEVEESCSGVLNGYREISQMGIDRWLALLAAYTRYQSACLVIDAGSAVTVDLLQADGRHVGGYIVPGLQMMTDALFRNTGRVKLESLSCDVELRAGESTRQAVAAGLPSMLLGLIRRAYDELNVINSPLGGVIEVVLTGGDSERLAALLAHENMISVKREPDLVLDGLQLSVGEGGVKK